MKKLIFIITILFTFTVFADDTPPDTSFGDGIQFKHEPSNFKMKMRFRVQGRATYTDYDEESTSSDKTGFEVRRARMNLDGTILDSRLFYKIQLAFTRGDMDWDTNAYPNLLRDAVVGWKFTDKNSVFFGQGKLPGNRQRVISSSRQELVDRSLLNSTFNLDRDIGLQSWNQFGDTQPLWIKLALSNGEGRASDNTDTGTSSTVRVEWLPLGAFANEGDYTEGDLEFEETPKLSIGVVYNYNNRSHRLGGAIGKYITGDIGRNLKSSFADLMFKYQGFALESEYANRKTDNPIIDAHQFVMVGEAAMVQASYTMRNFYAPVVRWTKLWPEEQIYSRADIKTQYTVGLTKYFNKHKVKLQGDVTYEDVDKVATQANQQNWIARLQFEVGI